MKNKQSVPTKSITPKIQATDDVIRALMAEFEVVYQTVRVSLRFYSHSPKAKAIRKRAIEMMTQVSDQNHQLLNDFDR